MVLIHNHEAIIFYTVTTLMLIIIFGLVLILIYSPYNDYQTNIKNIISFSDMMNKDFQSNY
jgi:L-asparagine transporter-like permease